MARRYYSSTAVATTLAAPASNSATSIEATALSGYPVSTPFTAIIDPDTASEEVVEVTGVSGTTLTVTRGVDGTTAVSHSAGAVFRHGVSGRDFDEANDHVNTTGNPHSTTASDVGAVANSLVDAKGDLISATANDTPARLGVGANGTVLTADSATATGLKWAAAGMSVIDTQTFNSSTTYTMPVGAKLVAVEVIGGGGGGSNGTTGLGQGGNGGTAGAAFVATLDAATLGASVTVTVGSGGVAGNVGGSSRFGLVNAVGGRWDTANGWAGPNTSFNSVNNGLGGGGFGGAQTATTGLPGKRGTNFISGGGGGGGGSTNVGGANAGAAGGSYSENPASVYDGTSSAVTIQTGGGGIAGTLGGGAGGNGTSRAGGGGGGANTSGAGGAGGTGATPGGGGGGGGTGSTAGGAGGTGGNGQVRIWVYG